MKFVLLLVNNVTIEERKLKIKKEQKTAWTMLAYGT
jgi:hypothetical protein